MEYLILIFSLLAILVSAEFFTNGVEVFGDRFSLSQAVVGSILAAVGTALPETIIPMVAILLYRGEGGIQIGTGAILGAPFMLATLGMCMVGLGALISYLKKKREHPEVFLEVKTFKRDFAFFLLSYCLAIAAGSIFPEDKILHLFIAIFLLIIYFFYIYRTFRADSLEVETHEDLYLVKILKKVGIVPSTAFEKFLSILQVLAAVLIMVKGAHLFVGSLEKIALKFGLDPLLFSLLIAPVATELPEKFNSLLWSLRNRDILALGNISGAMVFQSTFPVSIGLIFTPWKISGLALVSALIALSLILIYMFYVHFFKRLPIPLIILSGLAYLGYCLLIILNIGYVSN